MMQTKIQSIQVKQTRRGDLFWACTCENGAYPNIFNLTDIDNPLLRRHLSSSELGQVYDLDPPVGVTVAEDSRGYFKILRMDTQSVAVELRVAPVHQKAYQDLAHQSAKLQFNFLADCDDLVTLDAETTGVDPKQDEFVSLAIYGENDFSSLIKPSQAGMKRLENSGAIDIHHITPTSLANEQAFEDVYPVIRHRLAGKIWAVYNADYDVTMLDSLCERHGLPRIPRLGVHCIMKLYAEYRAVPGEKGGWKWHKLSEACHAEDVHLDNAHDALADASATYDLIQKIGAK